MYKNLEEYYKKNNIFNIITRRTFLIYFVFVLIAFLLGIKFNAWLTFGFIVLILFAFIIQLLIKMEVKIIINKKTKKMELGKYLSIQKENIKIVKIFLKQNKMMEKEIIKDLLEHYRNAKSVTIKGGNFITWFGLFLTVIFYFIDINGINWEKFEIAIPYMLIFILFYIFSVSTKQIIKMYKGEIDLYDELEEILGEIYIEIINKERKKKI